MHERSGESLEFYAVESDEQPVEFSRASFRVRVADRDGFLIQFGTLSIPLADISTGGVSLLSNNEATMALGDIICSCELTVEDEHFSGLSGRVVHHSLDGNGRTITGIQWLDLNPIMVKRFQALLSQLRKRVFKRD
ncbi:MAG: PilZ domain-containing protein [Gammaproteobacteria bacterium]|nr:PilZ domain-containing protein [Gammaproteobacteria bacterium]